MELSLGDVFQALRGPRRAARLARSLHGRADRELTVSGVRLVWRWREARAVLADRSQSCKAPDTALAGLPDGPFRRHNAATLAFMDPPRHTRVRQVLAASFTHDAVAALTRRVDERASALVRDAVRRESVDLVDDLAAVLPMRVICDLLGEPARASAVLRQAASAVTRGLEPGAGPARLAAADAAVEAMTARLRRRVEDGGRGLFAVLAGAVREGCLSPEEALHQAIFMLNAGHETTARVIAAACRRLTDQPGLAKAVRERTVTAEAVVEETLRLHPPLQIVFRHRSEAQGRDEASRRQAIVLVIHAANRDPEVFARPHRFDAGRANARQHLSFAAGPHTCLGANLARIEAAAAVRALADAQIDARPAGRARHGAGPVFGGYESLPMRLVSSAQT